MKKKIIITSIISAFVLSTIVLILIFSRSSNINLIRNSYFSINTKSLDLESGHKIISNSYPFIKTFSVLNNNSKEAFNLVKVRDYADESTIDVRRTRFSNQYGFNMNFEVVSYTPLIINFNIDCLSLKRTSNITDEISCYSVNITLDQIKSIEKLIVEKSGLSNIIWTSFIESIKAIGYQKNEEEVFNLSNFNGDMESLQIGLVVSENKIAKDYFEENNLIEESGIKTLSNADRSESVFESESEPVYLRNSLLDININIVNLNNLILLTDNIMEHAKEKISEMEYKNKKVIALTFDDGPHSSNTPELLDILKKYDVKATFFVNGYRIPENKETVKRIFEEGHIIGNHTYNHKDLAKQNSDTINYEIDGVNNLIKDITGITPDLYRPPYGSKNTLSNEIVKSKGMGIILWSIDPLDWKFRNAVTVCENVVSQAEDGDIILLHDIHRTSVEAVEPIIKELKDKGFIFLTVPDMIELKESMESGKSYTNITRD